MKPAWLRRLFLDRIRDQSNPRFFFANSFLCHTPARLAGAVNGV